MEVGISVCDSAHVSAVAIGAGVTLTLTPSRVVTVHFEEFFRAYYRRLSSRNIRYKARFTNQMQHLYSQH
jgi:hypothetical protein